MSEKEDYLMQNIVKLNQENMAEFFKNLLSKQVSNLMELIKRDINIHWACETRVDNLTEEIIDLMVQAGCKALYLGIESGSKRVLKLSNINISISQIKNTINAYCSLITGIPGETYFDYLKTLFMMKKFKPYSYNFNIFVGLPGKQNIQLERIF